MSENQQNTSGSFRDLNLNKTERQSGLPLVSVVIPVYNGEKFILECLRSVAEQTYPRIQCIVVNDGSTDQTVDVIRQSDLKVELVNQDHKNLPSARNTGIRYAAGDFIALLDADDLWYPDKIEAQVQMMMENPGAGLVFSDTEKFFPSGKIRYQKDKRELSLKLNNEDPFPILIKKNIIVPSSVLIRSSIFKEIGYFDETLNSCEDWEFWLRFPVHHLQIRFLDRILTKYRFHGGNMSTKADSMQQGRLQALDKVFSDPLLHARYSKLKNQAHARIYDEAANAFYSAGNSERFLSNFNKAWKLSRKGISGKTLRRWIRLKIFGKNIG